MTLCFPSSHISHVESSHEWMVSTLNTQSQTLTIPVSKTLELCEQGSMFNSMILQKFRNGMKGLPYQLMHQLWSGPRLGSQIDRRSARMSWHNNNQLLHNYGPRFARYSTLQHWETYDTNTQWTVWCCLNQAHIHYTFNDCKRIENTFLQLGANNVMTNHHPSMSSSLSMNQILNSGLCSWSTTTLKFSQQEHNTTKHNPAHCPHTLILGCKHISIAWPWASPS
jgi:hypothetical protein